MQQQLISGHGPIKAVDSNLHKFVQICTQGMALHVLAEITTIPHVILKVCTDGENQAQLT